MKYSKPELVQLLESLSLHDRRLTLDMLLRYPEMADILAKLYVMKKSGADAVEVEQFEASCFEKIKQIYGKK
jgi:hypothetical protein